MVFALCTGLITVLFGRSADAETVVVGNAGVRYSAPDAGADIVFVDKHTYRHCHNIHTRVYCHKIEYLPMNWAPLSETPHGRTYENPPEPPSSIKGHSGS